VVTKSFRESLLNSFLIVHSRGVITLEREWNTCGIQLQHPILDWRGRHADLDNPWHGFISEYVNK
jgi:hypothetical protein